MSTTTDRIPLPPIPPREGPLRDGLGRPVGETPEDRAERTRWLCETFAEWAREWENEPPDEPPDLDDQIAQAIREARR